MRALLIATLASALAACTDSNVVLQRQVPSSVQAIGPLVASPKGRIVLSISRANGVSNQATITFTQSGVTADPALTFTGNTCFGSPPVSTDALNVEDSSRSLENGTFTVTYDVRAQTHRYCVFTVISNGKTASIPFTVNL